MGCSNPHPHCQVWATSFLPNTAARKDVAQKEYLAKHGTPLLVDYVALELKEKTRIVVENEHWIAVVPFWALWPYETMVLPKRHVQRFPDLTDAERDALANITKRSVCACMHCWCLFALRGMRLSARVRVRMRVRMSVLEMVVCWWYLLTLRPRWVFWVWILIWTLVVMRKRFHHTWKVVVPIRQLV